MYYEYDKDFDCSQGKSGALFRKPILSDFTKKPDKNGNA